MSCGSEGAHRPPGRQHSSGSASPAARSSPALFVARSNALVAWWTAQTARESGWRESSVVCPGPRRRPRQRQAAEACRAGRRRRGRPRGRPRANQPAARALMVKTFWRATHGTRRCVGGAAGAGAGRTGLTHQAAPPPGRRSPLESWRCHSPFLPRLCPADPIPQPRSLRVGRAYPICGMWREFGPAAQLGRLSRRGAVGLVPTAHGAPCAPPSRAGSSSLRTMRPPTSRWHSR